MPKTPEDSNQLSFADLADHANLHGKTIYLVDGSSYIYRAFYAIRNLSNSAGMPTNAIYGFTQMLKKLIEDENPDLIAMTFDAFSADEHTFRKELYDDYKANRSAMPDELRVQIPYFRKVVEALNIPIMEQAGVEADDLIATATARALEVGLNVCIISADKDLMQLLGDGVSMLDTMRGRRYSPADVLERFNVTPERVKYVLALAGDTSDNIPGVPGIGEKTGGKLIAEFGDLETLLANIDKVSGKKRKENLTEFADQARLSLELVTLRDDCPIIFDVEHLHLSPPHFEALTHLFHELEFESVLHDLNRWFKSRGWLDDRDIEDLKDSLLENEVTRSDESRKDYRAIFSIEELDEVLAACKEAGRFAFDLETTSVDPLEARIVGMSFAYKPNHGVYVPVAHSYEGAPKQLSLDAVLARVAPLLEDPALPKIGQHYKYEWLVLHRHGVGFKGVTYDTMLMSYVLDPGKNSHGLDTIAFDFLNHRNIKFSDVAGSGKKQLTFDQVPLDKATPYASEDADITLMACDALLELLNDEPQLLELHDTLEIPLSRVLGIMELNGVKVDCEILNQLSGEFEIELEKLQDEINVHAGSEVNPNSPTQLREVLFERLDLPVKKRTKTGPSTDQSVLEQLSELHPLPRLILEYRSFSKLKGTYVDALPELIREDTGRIHTDFNQAVAATGRLSSSNPNLQNIPIRTDRGREIRKAFVADDKHMLLAADYSQIELRIMAHLSGDPVLLKAYREGQDIHALTASQIFDIDINAVTGEQRRAGKTINFGVMYGMGPRRLARDLDISMPEAKSYIENYFERYEGVATYFDRLVADAVETGYALTMFGRKRLLPTLENKGAGRAFAERAAINTPIQGTAADIIKLAMIAIQDRIEAEKWPARMLLQVHDELIFEIAEDALDELRPKICAMMETIVTLDAPLVVDSGIGKNWFDAK